MSDSPSSLLPPLRRVVTAHDSKGQATVESNVVLEPEVSLIDQFRSGCLDVASKRMESIQGAQSAAFWVTTDGLPVNDNNICDDGAKRIINDSDNFGLVHPSGTNLRSTDLDPGAATPMHRTSSLDYNILGLHNLLTLLTSSVMISFSFPLVSGELILITEDGTETHLKYPGDTVIQRGTMHAWRNPSGTRSARWISVLIAAKPAVIDGEALTPQLVPYEPKV